MATPVIKKCITCEREFKAPNELAISYCLPCRRERWQNKNKAYNDELERRKKKKEETYYGDE